MIKLYYKQVLLGLAHAYNARDYVKGQTMRMVSRW